MKFDANDMVPNEDHSLRVSMENLRLRYDCSKQEYIRESHPVSWRLQRSHFTSGQLNETKDVFKQLEVWGAYPKDGSTDKYQ